MDAHKWGPFLWGPRLDLLAFGGSAALAFALVGAAHLIGLADAGLPAWAWVAFVLLVDVAHVYSTLFRTYFDGREVRAHPVRYYGLPAVLYAGLVVVYGCGELIFWRVLAYVALFHFVRQQAGWVALYRARAGQGRLDTWLDNFAVYLATLYPVVYWHAHLDRVRFSWFLPGDFVVLSAAARVLPAIQFAWLVSLAAFVVRQLWLYRQTRVFALGKTTVVATTALGWSLGIVATNSDFAFTVTNVLLHGVPYIVLLYVYASKRAAVEPGAVSQERLSLASRILSLGGAGFVAVLVLLAYVEEHAWDRLVYHERSWLFWGPEFNLTEASLAWLVPLLALPQVTHYALDGVLWRRSDTAARRTQQLSLGYE